MYVTGGKFILENLAIKEHKINFPSVNCFSILNKIIVRNITPKLVAVEIMVGDVNSVRPSIYFTIEEEHNNQISFLGCANNSDREQVQNIRISEAPIHRTIL